MPGPGVTDALQHNGVVPQHALQRIVVVPRNGYANRLQAWASAAAMGRRLGVPVQLLWAPQPIATAPAELLFDADLVQRVAADPEEVARVIGGRDLDAPKHLTRRPHADALVLSGDLRGEQAFMDGLERELRTDPLPRLLVIIAGGHFHLPGTEDARAERRACYRELAWSVPVRDALAEAREQHPDPYLGLHLRGTDRSVTAPSEDAVRDALAVLAERTGIEHLLVAADTAEARDTWTEAAHRMGLRPWSVEHASFDRSLQEAGVGALVDWALLGMASGLVYPRSSSFGHEAAVAVGDRGPTVGLQAPLHVQRARRAGAVARNGWRRLRRMVTSSDQASA